MGIFLSFIACKSVICFSISQIYIVITFYCVRCAFRQKVFCFWLPSCMPPTAEACSSVCRFYIKENYSAKRCEAVFVSCRFLFRQIKYCQYYAAAAMPCKLKPVGARCKCSINACTFAWICAVYQVKCRAGLKVFYENTAVIQT